MYPTQQSNMFFNVNGYEGAVQFQCLPNQVVVLLDSQGPYLYMKSANQFGQASIKCYELKELDMNPERKKEEEWASALERRLKELEEKVNGKPVD